MAEIKNAITGAVQTVTKNGIARSAITGRERNIILGCGDSPGGGDIPSSGMDISEMESTTIPLVHNSVVKYSLTTDDVITLDIAGLTADKSVTMELWLTMPEEVVSFTMPDVIWIEEPSFDTANTLYAVVIRWDGEKVIGNVAYTLEVS